MRSSIGWAWSIAFPAGIEAEPTPVNSSFKTEIVPPIARRLTATASAAGVWRTVPHASPLDQNHVADCFEALKRIVFVTPSYAKPVYAITAAQLAMARA